MKNRYFQVTILGSGTSQGVPVIACDCDVCRSEDSYDKRLRTSILLTINGFNYVVDSGPDFRQQMLREGVKTLEAIFFTHEHKDHIAGLDDVRAFNFSQQKKMKIYCDKNVENAIRREYHYIFSPIRYPGIPKLDIEIIDKNTVISIANDEVINSIEVMHHKLPILGFRYKNFTYITDAKTISIQEKEKILGTETLIINALRKETHLSHFNVEEALSFIKEINPQRAYLTHISHLMGKHSEIEKTLPKNVFLAYDGLKLTLKD